eukprot:Sdes_comp24248_c0_seq1m22253
MNLGSVIRRFKSFAPLNLSASWDNVGLLVEPSEGDSKMIQKVLLTIDLTEKVMDEACRKRADLIMAYHPPIFSGLKRLTSSNAKERILLKSIENKIAIYSPHTAFDCVSNGLTDWLAASVGDGAIKPINPSATSSKDFEQ